MEQKFEELLKQIETMSVLELSQFVKALEEKFGVSGANMPMMMAPGAGAVGQAAPEDEKSIFTVVLTDAGLTKIQVIKVVKDVTGKGLKEAKDLVDNLPSTLKEGVKKEEAEELKKKVEAAGGKVELK